MTLILWIFIAVQLTEQDIRPAKSLAHGSEFLNPDTNTSEQGS